MKTRFGLVMLLAVTLMSDRASGQCWVEVGVKKALIEKINVEINTQVRLRSRVSELYWYRTEVGPVYRFEDWIGVGLFLENREEWHDGKWQGLNSFGFHGRLSGEFGWLRVMDVNRLDCEALKTWRYRNLLALLGGSHVIAEKTGFYGEEGLTYRIAPCVENEVFVSVTDNELDENHLFLGVLFQITPFADFRLGCLLFTEKEGDEWEHQVVAMTAMELTFLQLE